MQRLLPVKSLSYKMVAKRKSLSLEGFLRDHILPGSPVIISDGMVHWPAKSNWNDMNYLKKIAGFRTVPVEVIDFFIIVIPRIFHLSINFLIKRSFTIHFCVTFAYLYGNLKFLVSSFFHHAGEFS